MEISRDRDSKDKPGPRINAEVIAWIENYKVQNGRLPSGPMIVKAHPGLALSTAYLYRSRAGESNVVPLKRSHS
jgi:hypothetical protein